LDPIGTLDFYYEVANDPNSVTAISCEPDTSFLGFATAVAFRVDGASLSGTAFTNGTPGIFPVTADGDASATTVGFNFVPTPPGTKIPPGTSSAVLIISTDATHFTAGNSEVLDGGAETVAAFQPTAIPEPGSFALIRCRPFGISWSSAYLPSGLKRH
jgi:hypothetical protein